VPQIDVSFEIDANGILTVGAVESVSGHSQFSQITSVQSHLSEDEINRMMKDAESYAAEDRIIHEKVKALNSLQNYVWTMTSLVRDKGGHTANDEKAFVLAALKDVDDWMDENGILANVRDLETKLMEIKLIASPIITTIYNVGSEEKLSSHKEL